jgi:hypothetical protein
MEGVVAHVGYTNFAVKLIENIRVNVSTVNNTTNTYTPKPPACYGALKQQPDMASLQAYIASLGFQQISACFVYALYEKVDNHIILLELAKHLGSNLDVADISTICTIISNDDYDKENWDCVMSSGLPIVNSLVIFGDR